MEVLDVDDGTTWSFEFGCARCGASCRAAAADLCVDDFKVSGHFWAGTEVCERRFFVHCGACGKLSFLDAAAVDDVPFLLASAAGPAPRTSAPAGTGPGGVGS